MSLTLRAYSVGEVILFVVDGTVWWQKGGASVGYAGSYKRSRYERGYPAAGESKSSMGAPEV